MRDSEPWFVTPLIKILLRQRNSLYHRGRVQKAEELSSKINKLIAEVRSDTLSNIDAGDSKKLWNMVQRTTNYKNNNSGFLNSIGCDSIEKLSEINASFADIASDPNYDSDKINDIVHASLLTCKHEDVHEVSEYEICKILSTLKKTSPGPDGIPHWVFRNCAIELTPVLTHIINLSLRTGVVPDAWKRALVTPVLKVKKVSEYKGHSDLRPISVTSILSRTVERLVVQKYLWPSLNNDMMNDQFGFRPTGSTACALIYMLHTIYSMFESGNDYVRCILIDYSKAFDVIDHATLMTELGCLGLHASIYRWICNFLTGRTQAVKALGLVTAFLAITRSIVQGSGIGPMLYIALARRLKTLSKRNALSKYADDTSLMSPQHTDCSIEQEFEHVVNWSIENKLTINKTKTQEIIFYKSNKIAHKHDIPLIPGIARVEEVRLLGVILTSNLSWSRHIDSVLICASQRLYLINQLKYMALGITGLSNIFRALVVSKMLYAITAISGSLNQSDINRLDATIRKAKRWGLTNMVEAFSDLSENADAKLFTSLQQNPGHCLTQLLPNLNKKDRYSLRNKTKYDIPLIKTEKLLKSFIIRCCLHEH